MLTLIFPLAPVVQGWTTACDWLEAPLLGHSPCHRFIESCPQGVLRTIRVVIQPESSGCTNLRGRSKWPSAITRITGYSTGDWMSGFMICKCRIVWGHTWHWMSLLRACVIKKLNTNCMFCMFFFRAEWLTLKKEYLDLQKSNMKQLKEALKKVSSSSQNPPPVKSKYFFLCETFRI